MSRLFHGIHPLHIFTYQDSFATPTVSQSQISARAVLGYVILLFGVIYWSAKQSRLLRRLTSFSLWWEFQGNTPMLEINLRKARLENCYIRPDLSYCLINCSDRNSGISELRYWNILSQTWKLRLIIAFASKSSDVCIDELLFVVLIIIITIMIMI